MKKGFALGILGGVIFPLLAYLATSFTSIQTSLFVYKPIALYVIAATINLFVVRFLYHRGKEAVANGIVLATFLAMIVLIVTMRDLVFAG